MSIALAQAGARVVIAEVNQQRTDEVLAEAGEKSLLDQRKHILTDVTIADSADDTIAETVEHFDDLFGLVSCEGIGQYENGVAVLPRMALS